MKQFTITRDDSGQRLNKFLEKAVPLLPGGLMHKYIRLKRIKVNGKRTDFAYRLQEGDLLQLYINDEFFGKPKVKEQPAYLSARPNISVIYEDEHILLVNKPAGLVVHEDDSGTTDTLIARIQAYLYQYGRWNPNDAASFAPALCNRIDRGTSGIVIAAKTAEALRVMNQKIRDRELHKTYLCVACGRVRPKEGRIQNYILRHEDEHRVSVHDRPVPGARTAITQYRVRKDTAELSLVECDLITGRTHQLRAQFAHMGHPLLGDSKYGTNEMNRKYRRKAQVLCSYRLRFDFTTDAGALAYLNGRTFTVPHVEFLSLFDG
ncbi:MAG TPA: RluA family pseudouridine synthase [Candidatus Butyricicoccus stercorigallinarum]|nr:RluA family pseudouridine synthase [Candidatus Butyricicoccus stercorigallinarum]